MKRVNVLAGYKPRTFQPHACAPPGSPLAKRRSSFEHVDWGNVVIGAMIFSGVSYLTQRMLRQIFEGKDK